ncbi:MAG: CpXC domain-containing protein, partial [Candidatus Kryptoniota bacterium]
MVWESLNVTVDSDLKKKLFAGEINKFECEKCGNKAFVNAPILYHDMEQQFCVQYYPSEMLDDSDFLR